MNKILQSKQFWNNQPCNIKHSQQELGSLEYFNEVELKRYFVEPHNYKFAEFSKWKGKRILELGCGIGTDTINFARAGAIVDAIDLSPKSLELARRRAEIFNLHINFYHGNIEKIEEIIKPWSQQYDLIYSFGVIHHCDRPEEVIRKLHMYCKEDTTLKLMLYHKYSIKVFRILLQNLYKLPFNSIEKIIADNAEAQFGCPIVHTYSKKELTTLLYKYNIKISSIKSYHIFPYIIKYYKQNIYKKSWYYRWMPKQLFNYLQSHFGWHLLINAQVNRKSI